MKILATQKNMTSFRGSMLNRQRDKIGRFLPNPLIKRDAHLEAQRLVEDFVEIAAKEKNPKVILENMQALLGGIQSGSTFKLYSDSAKMESLRGAITNLISKINKS